MRAQADAPKRCMQFLAIGDHDTPLGLVEARMRLDPVHGAHASPTAYLEGIYVEPGARRQGVARLLLHAVMAWAHEQGCSELASDTGIDNTISRAVHEQLGFAETERVVFYRMVLGQPNQAS